MKILWIYHHLHKTTSNLLYLNVACKINIGLQKPLVFGVVKPLSYFILKIILKKQNIYIWSFAKRRLKIATAIFI